MKAWSSVPSSRKDVWAASVWATRLASLFVVTWIDRGHRVAALEDNWRSNPIIPWVRISLWHHGSSAVWGLSQSCHAGVSVLSFWIAGLPRWWPLRVTTFFFYNDLLAAMIPSTVLRETSSTRVIILILDMTIPSDLFLTLIRIQLTGNHSRVLAVLSTCSRRALNTVFIVLLLLLNPVEHALLSVISSELIFIRHELSLLLRVWIIGHWWSVLWSVHHTLSVTSRSSVYFHGTSSLAISFRIATLITLAVFTVFLVERSTKRIFIIRPLLLYQRLIDALLVRIVAFHLGVNSLLIVQALI